MNLKLANLREQTEQQQQLKLKYIIYNSLGVVNIHTLRTAFCMASHCSGQKIYKTKFHSQTVKGENEISLSAIEILFE